MKYIALMDTSVRSFNLGDSIIMESAEKGLESILRGNFVVKMPTHSPLFHKFEFSIHKNDGLSNALTKFDYKFICGTNLLEKNMKKRQNTWDYYLSDTKYFNDFILVGVGTDSLDKIRNSYTKRFYNHALSHKYIHSVRDGKAKELLQKLGFKAVDTGCVSLWSLTKEWCAKIPTSKASNVIFTLTDYQKNPQKDKYLIQILLKNYKSVYFWPQGIGDWDYLNSLMPNDLKGINVISPSLPSYDNFLKLHDCDFVGTRLHAGIKAMQRGRRSIILGVDNRALDMHKEHHLNYISRNNIQKLDEMINNDIITNIKLDLNAINVFLNQFK